MTVFLMSERFEAGANWQAATPEILDIREAARRHGIDSVPTPPGSSWLLARVAATPKLWLSGREVQADDALIVRGIREWFGTADACTRAIQQLGGYALDPVSRYRGGGSASKTLSTLDRARSGVGSESLVISHSSTPPSQPELKECLDSLGSPPWIVKPGSGRQGEGVVRTTTKLALIKNVLSTLLTDDAIIQRDEDFQREFRVMILQGRVLGVAEKILAPSSVAANASRGTAWKSVSQTDAADVQRIALESTENQGLIGADVGVTAEGRHVVIEANSAPQWTAFAEATGVDVAGAIIDDYLAWRGK